jgi:hypothetical protein
VLALSVLAAGGSTAATPRVDERQLLDLGFKVLVATTTAQQEWVKRLPPGKIRPMQRNGKKFFVYPDAPRNQVYVGGPKEYEAYQQLHPETKKAAQEAANRESAYRAKESDAMREASARDLSNPFLGVTWGDFGY